MKPLITTLALLLFSWGAYADEKADAYLRNTALTRDVATRYFHAYINKHWDTVESLMALNVNFADPTAEQVFDGVKPVSGKLELIKNFRENYAYSEFSFKPLREVFSGSLAMFEGVLDWELRLPKRSIKASMPMVIMLKVENGRVVEHRDLADYRSFIDAERATRPAATVSEK